MSSFDAREALRMAKEQMEIARANGKGDEIIVPPKRRRIINEKPRTYPTSGIVKKVNISDDESKPDEPWRFKLDEPNDKSSREDVSQQNVNIPHMDEDTIIRRYNEAAANRMKSTAISQNNTVLPNPVKQTDMVNVRPDAGVDNMPVHKEPHLPDGDAKTDTPSYDNGNVAIPTAQSYMEPVYTDGEFALLDEIPSLNLFYPNKLSAQPLKLLDLLIIENLDDTNSIDSFSEIYHRRINGIHPLEIASGDEIYILQYLRASTFESDPYTWKKFTCSHCGYKIDDNGYKIDFTNMRFNCNKDPHAIYDLHKEYGYHPIKISNGYLKAFIRRRKHDAIYKTKVAELKQHGIEVTKPYLALLNTALILDIDGCNTLDSKIEFLGNLNKNDAYTMFSELKECSFKTTTHVVHRCPNCGGETVNPFPFRYDTFISSVQLNGNTKK